MARVIDFAAMIWGLRRIALAAGAFALGGVTEHAGANPTAMGVSRVMTVDARALPLIGSHDYGGWSADQVAAPMERFQRS